MDTATASELHQYLTFRLGEETFALDIGRVREVLEYTTVTALPRMPDFMQGVINLRGNVVPVVDLRVAFGMTKGAQTVNTCVIIVEMTGGEGETIVIGAMADSVQEVIELERRRIEPAPKIGSRLCNRSIKGMGNHNGRFIIILDGDLVFTEEEAALVHAAGHDPEEAAFPA